MMAGTQQKRVWLAPIVVACAIAAVAGAVMLSVAGFAGVANRFADASAKEGSWGRQASFEIAPNLTTGRSVSVTQPLGR